MKNKLMKNTLAAVMALAMVGGAMPTTFGGKLLLSTPIVAHAADGYATLTGDTLTIGGNITKDIVSEYCDIEDVKHIVAAEGTVLPSDCSELFRGVEVDFGGGYIDVHYCWLNVESIDLSNADSSNVTDMTEMFDNLHSPKSIDLNGFNTENVTVMYRMFYKCSNLKMLDISSFNTENVTDMTSMFCECSSLKTLDISSFNTTNVEDMYSMFADDPLLESITVSDDWNVSNVSLSTDMFSGCFSLKGQNGTEVPVDSEQASDCNKTYARIDKPGMKGYLCEKGHTPSMATFFADEATLYIGGCVDIRDIYGYHDYAEIKHIVALPGTVLPENSSGLITGKISDESWINLETIDFSKADSSKTTNMTGMFQGLQKLKSIDLSSFNTENVTSMWQMFYDDKSLETLDLSTFDTSNVTKMNSMFRYCSNLTGLDLSSFDTSNVTDMQFMFASCTSLESIIVSDKWNTSKIVTDDDDSNLDNMAQSMFAYCTSLEGRKGTKFNKLYTDSEYARIDTVNKSGYFRFKDENMTYVEGVSLTLDGNLDVNFYIDSTQAKKAVLNGPSGEIVFNSDQINAAMSNGLIKLSYPVNATQASAKVSLRLYDGEDRILDVYNSNFVLDPDMTIECSVNDYLAAAKPEKNWHSADIANFNALVKATKNYVDAADNFFNGAKKTISDVSSIDVFKDSDYGNADYLKGNKMALVLNSETAVRIFYNGDETSATLKQFDDNGHLQITGTLEKKNNKDGDYFEIANIPAHKLCDIIVLDIGNKELMFNPLMYGWRVKKLSSDEKLKTLCCALYDYANAASAFNSDFGNV